MASTSLRPATLQPRLDTSAQRRRRRRRTTWKTPDGVGAAAEEETHPSRTLRRSLHLLSILASYSFSRASWSDDQQPFLSTFLSSCDGLAKGDSHRYHLFSFPRLYAEYQQSFFTLTAIDVRSIDDPLIT
ncbi:hypothetical protein MGYG_00999 [Nannizzia gypsea CBS 118893]|uniref:Uncharacterized protein n=1 Tax=Arthroderma gypseum (strain ATCC MYA-4604 / CBS 118893) TaxID=535722 RepID=E5R3E8_ARTGP|nr:hypothetical protein MGYG_00999 [Nannizzia gypsea CBS 118893]EFQ97963.1 hypothetical protein MGYG_00999 [Nannizzia gypsea CBS 118893]